MPKTTLRSELCVVVGAPANAWVYVAHVVRGTPDRYYPEPLARIRRFTARGAVRAGQRWIESHERRAAREMARGERARRATEEGRRHV